MYKLKKTKITKTIKLKKKIPKHKFLRKMKKIKKVYKLRTQPAIDSFNKAFKKWFSL